MIEARADVVVGMHQLFADDDDCDYYQTIQMSTTVTLKWTVTVHSRYQKHQP